jgi:hypothetical protein
VAKRTARQRELDELDKEEAREIAREDRASLQRLSLALRNAAGIERIRAISDEEWEAAVQAGEPVEEDAA